MLRKLLRSLLALSQTIGLARKEDAASGFNRQHLRHRSVADALAKSQPDRAARILDVGCGLGGLSSRLAEAGYTRLSGCDWLGADAVSSAPPGFAYTQVDLNRDGLSAFADGSFDAIVCSDVVEHLENPAAILREFRRLLVPGGVAIMSIPNGFNLLERLSWLTSGNSTRYKRELSVTEFGHISVLPSQVLASLAARAGLNLQRPIGGYAYLDGYILRGGRSMSPTFSYNIIWPLVRPADSDSRPA